MRSISQHQQPSIILILSTVLSLLDSCLSSSLCPLFRCTPDIIALDNYSINSTLDIKCVFLNRIEDPSDVMWKFALPNNVERVINDLDGGILPPFKHVIKATNLTISNGYIVIGHSGTVGSQSILRIPLLNESYYTNYTIMHTRDSCQQTVRVHLKETAMGYSGATSGHCATWLFVTTLCLLPDFLIRHYCGKFFA